MARLLNDKLELVTYLKTQKAPNLKIFLSTEYQSFFAVLGDGVGGA